MAMEHTRPITANPALPLLLVVLVSLAQVSALISAAPRLPFSISLGSLFPLIRITRRGLLLRRQHPGTACY